jgi:hypothetical protein
MRLILIVGTVAVAMLLELRISQAAQMPWCAGTNKGSGTFSYNCTLPTYEMCVQEVIAGNRGFCGPNPNYRGPAVVPPSAKRKRHFYCSCQLSTWGLALTPPSCSVCEHGHTI